MLQKIRHHQISLKSINDIKKRESGLGLTQDYEELKQMFRLEMKCTKINSSISADKLRTPLKNRSEKSPYLERTYMRDSKISNEQDRSELKQKALSLKKVGKNSKNILGLHYNRRELSSGMKKTINKRIKLDKIYSQLKIVNKNSVSALCPQIDEKLLVSKNADNIEKIEKALQVENSLNHRFPIKLHPTFELRPIDNSKRSLHLIRNKTQKTYLCNGINLRKNANEYILQKMRTQPQLEIRGEIDRISPWNVEKEYGEFENCIGI